MSLAEALGFSGTDRLLIVNADDYGLCHSVNESAQQLLEAGAVSSATLMTPCAFAKEAAQWSAANPQFDVGVHLTFTSEWEAYKWGPVTAINEVSSLVNEDGHFYPDAATFEERAEEEHVRTEMINQLEKAISYGMTPSHADNHMGSLYGLKTGRHFMPQVLDVCAKYGLPFRLPRYLNLEHGQIAPRELEENAKQVAALADSKGVVVLDYLVGLPFRLQPDETYDSFKAAMQHLLSSLKPGVTELIIHPSHVTDELHSFHQEAVKRGMEHRIFLDSDIKKTLQEEGIQRIKWRLLQQLQRKRVNRGS